MRSPASALALLGALSATGCTALGALIGSQIKTPGKQKRIAPVTELWQVQVGHTVVLHLKDGRVLTGTFGGVGMRDADEYARLYAEARDGLEPALPALGPVTLLARGRKEQRMLMGLNLDGGVFRSGRGTPDTIAFPSIQALSDAATSVSGDALQQLVLSREVPLLGEVRLESPHSRTPLDSVAQVEVPVLKGHAGAGALVGLVADAIVVAIAAQSLNDWGDSGTSCRTNDPYCTSCPFVSSFDGREWHEEAEVLGSALFASAQRVDRALLEHLAALDGSYRLKIGNTLAEVDFIDSLRLLVVDSDPGVVAVPGPGGELYSVSDTRPPFRVTDQRGSDFTQQLGESDGRVWFTNAFGRDPANGADLRDGLVIEFERPQGADAVTLVFDVRSSTWAVRMLTRLLALHGPGVESWRAQMNEDAGAREAFLAAVAREGLPAVSVWDGRTWRPEGVLTNLGPRSSRQQALRLDLRAVTGDTLRVGFAATPGFWIIDSVRADYSPARSLHVTALVPARARAGTQDVRDLLARADGERLRLDRGDVADVVFAASTTPPNRQRSLLVEARGYYTALVPDPGSPDVTLFERLVKRPGAFARFNLEEAAADLREAQRRAALQAEREGPSIPGQ